MSGNEAAWIALAGTLFGGSGLKIVEAYLGRNKRSARDDADALRTELRIDNAELRVELEKARDDIDRLEASVEEWRERYYALLAERSGADDDTDE